MLNAIKISPLTPFLESYGFAILDGGLATELEARGADLRHALWSAKILVEQPNLIRDVHLDYLRAGADIITTASYQATLPGLLEFGLTDREAQSLLRYSVALAREARAVWLEEATSQGRPRPLIAASIGPYGAYLADGSEYRGQYGKTVKDLIDFHRPRLETLLDAGPDLLAFETIPCPTEAEALLQLLSDYPKAWAWISFSARNGEEISEGQRMADMAALADASDQIAAIGVNCTAPRHIESLLLAAAVATHKPLIAYPNRGEGWDAEHKCWLPAPDEPSLPDGARRWFAAGARILGGCCRTGPADIQALRQVLSTVR